MYVVWKTLHSEEVCQKLEKRFPVKKNHLESSYSYNKAEYLNKFCNTVTMTKECKLVHPSIYWTSFTEITLVECVQCCPTYAAPCVILFQ